MYCPRLLTLYPSDIAVGVDLSPQFRHQTKRYGQLLKGSFIDIPDIGLLRSKIQPRRRQPLYASLELT